MRWTKGDDYTNFRRAQRERGPYYRGPLPRVDDLPQRRQFRIPRFSAFARLTALGSIFVFLAVLFGDKYIAQVENRMPVYYRNCDHARAAGAAPILRYSPDYRPELDADLDGIACEPHVGLPSIFLGW